LDRKIASYITDSYTVEKKSLGFADLKSPGIWYEDTTRRISHVFLAQHESEAGKKFNSSNIRLLQTWMVKRVKKRDTLIARVLTLASTLIRNYISGVDGIKLYASNRIKIDLNAISVHPFLLKAVITQKDGNSGSNKEEDKSVKLIKAVEFQEGFQLKFTDKGTHTFQPKLDSLIIRITDTAKNITVNGLLIVCEIPGVDASGSYNGSPIDVDVDKIGEEVIISSKDRQLFHRKYTMKDGIVQFEPEKVLYEEMQTVQVNLRPSTKDGWSHKIKIPKGYQRKISKVSVRDGILEVLVLEDLPESSAKFE